MLHGSGGLPDTKGSGSSDVDICLFHNDPASLLKYFPRDTRMESDSRGVVYKLEGYSREVNIYCSNGEWWQDAYLHRKTELTLNEQYPELSRKARLIKSETGASTEAAWAQVLGLGDEYIKILLDTEKTLEIARSAA